ncbi:MAG: YARHG domain-containing protein [Patiriisocius sp.]|uniref:YARHG domain-containing protein n=1 Tax=Patiriisocius sp. TaxID=2822396 RepID=UPI003EF2E769
MKSRSYILTIILITLLFSCGVSETGGNTNPSNNKKATNAYGKLKTDKKWMEESSKDFDYFLDWYEESGNPIASREHEIVDVSKNRNKKYLNKKRRLEAGVEDAYTLNFEYEGNWKSDAKKERVEFIYTFNDSDSLINKSMVTKKSYEIPLISSSNDEMSFAQKTIATKNDIDTVSAEMSPENEIETTTEITSNKKTNVHGLYPQASTTVLTINDLIAVSVPDLKIMRNEIFARHGHSFKEGGAMDTYFNLQSWYENKNLDATPLLTETEKANIKLIIALE